MAARNAAAAKADVLLEHVTLKLSCACGGSMEITAPTRTVNTYAQGFNLAHEGHHGAPHVVPVGATSGDISLKATPQYEASRRMGPSLPGVPW